MNFENCFIKIKFTNFIILKYIIKYFQIIKINIIFLKKYFYNNIKKY